MSSVQFQNLPKSQSIDRKSKQSQKKSDDIDLQIIDTKQQAQENQYHSTFENLKKNATNLFNQDLFSDDQFKLSEIKNNKRITIKRLQDIITPGAKLFNPEQLKKKFQLNSYNNLPHWPNFIPEIHMLPLWHYQTLIQPNYVNSHGFYHVVIWKDGRLIKETVDDTLYYDEGIKNFYIDQIPQTKSFKMEIWMHILLKVWAKCKGSYNSIWNGNSQPFQFLKLFSYPDWYITNPSNEIREKLITNINPIQKKELYAIAQTKKDINVGFYGLIPNSASYIIVGHQMQYEAIFIKIKSLTGTKWNGKKSSKQSTKPQDQIKLEDNEFIMPIDEFLNVFHLIYTTSSKYLEERQNIYYNRYSLNLDARQSKAKMIAIDVLPPNPNLKNNIHQPMKSPKQTTMNHTLSNVEQKQTQYTTNLTIFFPSVRAYDLTTERSTGKQLSNLETGIKSSGVINNGGNSSSNIIGIPTEFKDRKSTDNQEFVIPYCKILFGMQSQTNNLQASFVESMKEKMLENQDGDFLCVKSNIQFKWIEGTYFKGFDNSLTFLLKLKPGRYFLRFKIQTLKVEYRANLNVVSSTQVKIADPKMDTKQQQQFLRDILSSKARIQKRNLGYLNPIKKGAWFICNDDFDTLGYGYIVAQTRKSSDFKVELKIDPKMLRDYGYRIKDKKDQNKYTIMLIDGEGDIIILKLDENFDKSKERIWPPPGIELVRLWAKS